MRAFLALEIPEEIKEHLQMVADLVARRVRGVRWVKKEGQHITLKFFGEIPEARVWQMKEALSPIQDEFRVFPASLKSVDGFPVKRRARVIVVTLNDGSDYVKTLFNAIEECLLSLGVEPEAREYTPHITLGRAKEPVTLLDKDLGILEEEQFFVSRVVLFQSTLTKEGAIYTPHWDIKLGGSA